MAVTGLLPAAHAAELADINRALQNLPPQSGRFEQYLPNGGQAAGSFHIDWPQRLRFAYEPDGTVVTVKGRFVAVQERPEAEPNWFPVSLTPLAVIRSAVEHGIGSDMVTSFEVTDTHVAVGLADPAGELPGAAVLYFTPDALQLYAWRLADAQNLVTQTRLMQIRTVPQLDDAVFAITYDADSETID